MLEQLAGTVLVCTPIEVLDSWEELAACCVAASSDGSFAGSHTAWNEAYIMLVSCIDYALDMTCIQSVSQCFIVGGIL